MITGWVDANHELMARVTIQDTSGQDHEIEALIDTGFTGALTLPASTIAALGLTRHSTGSAVTATGAIVHFDLYPVTIIWDGVARYIFAQEINSSPLLRLRMLIGHDLRARVEPGGRVELEAIP
jgi:clan AA aspartic protease